MHLAPTQTLHVFKSENRRAEVQYVAGERDTKYRVVYMTKVRGAWRTEMPTYYVHETDAMDRARTWWVRWSEIDDGIRK